MTLARISKLRAGYWILKMSPIHRAEMGHHATLLSHMVSWLSVSPSASGRTVTGDTVMELKIIKSKFVSHRYWFSSPQRANLQSRSMCCKWKKTWSKWNYWFRVLLQVIDLSSTKHQVHIELLKQILSLFLLWHTISWSIMRNTVNVNECRFDDFPFSCILHRN